MSITREELIEMVLGASTPQKTIEMDRETYHSIRRVKDDAGEYFWKPRPNYSCWDDPGTFLGIEIAIAKEKCFQIRYEFPDGAFHIIKLEFPR